MLIKGYFRSKPYLFQLSFPFQALLHILDNCFLRGLNTNMILNEKKWPVLRKQSITTGWKSMAYHKQVSQLHLGWPVFFYIWQIRNYNIKEEQGFQNAEWLIRINYLFIHGFFHYNLNTRRCVALELLVLPRLSKVQICLSKPVLLYLLWRLLH